MLGCIDPTVPSVTIIGGGFAGLAAAIRLVDCGYAVKVFEQSDRFGGLIRTDRLEFNDHDQASKVTWFSEGGPQSLLVNQQVAAFMRRNGVDLEQLSPLATGRFILRGGRLRSFPLNVFETVKLLWSLLFNRATRSHTAKFSDRSIADWAVDHLGEPALRYLVEPALTGVYATSPEQLRMLSVWPMLATNQGERLGIKLLKRWMSPKKKGGPRTYLAAPAGGMEQLICSMVECLKQSGRAELKLNSKVTELPKEQNIVITVPAYAAAELLAPVCSETAASLRGVSYTPLTTVSVTTKLANYSTPPKGVGVLVPRNQGLETLGILFNSSSFPSVISDPAYCTVRLFLGGSWTPTWATAADEKILECVSRELEIILGLKHGCELHSKIYRWPRAIPCYSTELKQLWAQMPWTVQPGRVLFGNYTGTVSLRGMIESLDRFPCRTQV